MSIMQEFPIRWTSISNSYSASLNWLLGEAKLDRKLNLLPGISLGNGSELSAIDVVESHFDRLIASCEHTKTIEDAALIAPQSESANSNFEFSVPSLRTAIENLAPHLIPFVQIAEDIAETAPPLLPTGEFNLRLNEALVAEHKQQLNKKAIGIHPPVPNDDLTARLADNKYTLLAGLPVAISVIAFFWYFRRPRRYHLHST